LPPVLEHVARRAFLGTLFRPGQVDGVNVKSLIRVEVVFESRLKAAPAAEAAQDASSGGSGSP
jgi:hypothetical protein